MIYCSDCGEYEWTYDYIEQPYYGAKCLVDGHESYPWMCTLSTLAEKCPKIISEDGDTK